MATIIEKLNDISKALEAGIAVGPPGTLTQGAALGKEDLSPVMNIVTFQEKHLKLSKLIPVEKATQTMVQYERMLDYGQFGGSATLEVSAGQENTGTYVRAFVPMAFYADRRVVSFAAQAMQTFDGKKNLERETSNAALKIAADVEFDLFRGKADFANAGVFDGNPASIPLVMPGLLGIDPQVRQSDNIQSTQDLMFAEYGSSLSVVISVGGTLAQTNIEDGALRSANNFGEADKIYLSTDALASYNKLIYSNVRYVFSGPGSEIKNTGASLGQQWTSNGPVELESSNFLRGKTQPPVKISGLAPGAPTFSGGVASGSTAFVSGQVYTYYVSASNEAGESQKSANAAITLTSNGQQVSITISAGTGTVRWFNVYRSAASTILATSNSSMKFIGRVAAAASGATTFLDLGNKTPGGTTGFMLDKRGMEVHELIPFSSVDLAQTDTSHRKLFYRHLCLAVKTPRFNVLFDSLT
jgi:hypothetical protein